MWAVCEQRSEPRVICAGHVDLCVADSGQESRAELLDVSPNGFRVRHTAPELQPGREVSFQHRIFVGRARVMWTTRIGDQVQSGFQILRG